MRKSIALPRLSHLHSVLRYFCNNSPHFLAKVALQLAEIRQTIPLTSHTGALNMHGHEMRKEVTISNLYPIILQRLHLEI